MIRKIFSKCISRLAQDFTQPGVLMTRVTEFGWHLIPVDPAPCLVQLRPGTPQLIRWGNDFHDQHNKI